MPAGPNYHLGNFLTLGTGQLDTMISAFLFHVRHMSTSSTCKVDTPIAWINCLLQARASWTQSSLEHFFLFLALASWRQWFLSVRTWKKTSVTCSFCMKPFFAEKKCFCKDCACICILWFYVCAHVDRRIGFIREGTSPPQWYKASFLDVSSKQVSNRFR